ASDTSTMIAKYKILALLFTSVSMVAGMASIACAELPPLIPRKVLFGNPPRTNPKFSPDGKELAYIAPSKEGVANVWVQTWGRDDAHMVTRDTHQGIEDFNWTPDGRRLLYQQDLNGDENLHLYSIDLGSSLVRDLTPFVGARVQN